MEIADSIWLVSVYWSLKDVENWSVKEMDS
jgi:hypothetical protein